MGLILPQSVTVVPTGKMIAFYRNKGYDVKWRTPLSVDVSDLSYGSDKLVSCNCDYCFKEFQMPYSKYTEVMASILPKIACSDCICQKREECNMIIYGVKNVFELEETKKKIATTCLDKYGVDNYTKTDEYRKKYISTCLEKYGVEHPLQNSEIKAKVQNTNLIRYGFNTPAESESIKSKIENIFLEKYGVSSIFKSLIFQDRIRNTLLKKYGVNNPLKSKQIREKVSRTLYFNQTARTSTQQKYIHKLYGGELNGLVSYYNCDIVMKQEKLIIEYDGGGHQLSVILGKLTQEEFNLNELIRNKNIKKCGYKTIRIISRKDYLPSNEVLLSMLQYARDFFAQNPDRSWISFDIDSSCIYNAYHKESEGGIPYDFGSLRKIKKSDLQCNTLTTPSTTLSSPTLLLNSITA